MKTSSPISNRLTSGITKVNATAATALAFALFIAPQAHATADNFASATPFAFPAKTEFLNFSTTGFTGQPGELSHHTVARLSNPTSHSAWFKFTTLDSGFVTLNTIGSTYDTLLAVYTGTAVNKLTRIAQDDDGSGVQSTSSLSFGAKAGTTYYIAVDGFSGSSGDTNLRVSRFVPLLARTWTQVLSSYSFESSGQLTVNTTATGGVTGTLKLGGKTHPFTGAMTREGRIVVSIIRAVPAGAAAIEPAFLELTLDGSGSYYQLMGNLTVDTTENYNGINQQVTLRTATKFPVGGSCPQQGLYTFVSPPDEGVGYSFGSINISKLGIVTVTGAQGDGVPFTFSGPILDTGVAAVGAFQGWKTFGANSHLGADFTFNSTTLPVKLLGELNGRRGLKPGAAFLPGGAYIGSDIYGGPYAPPMAGARMNSVFDPMGAGNFFAANSVGNVVKAATLTTANTFTYGATNTPKLVMTATKATGLVSGSILIGGKTALFKGISVNHPTNANYRGFFGYCAGPAANGVMSFTP